MLKAGDKAPSFCLPDADMNRIDLDKVLPLGPVVLSFYPKDDTPGCTLAALEFTDLQSEFETLSATVFGISRDSCVSHGAFRDKHGLTIQLLADLDGEICMDYGVWQELEHKGQMKSGVLRSTFILDSEGLIRHALYGVRPKGHAAEVLELLRLMAK